MEMGASIAAASCRDRVWGSGLAALLLALFPWATPLADSDSARGQVEIRSAYTEFRDDVFYVNARIDYRLNQSALDALENGVRLNVELDVDVRRRRRLIWDPAVAELRQRYRLSYHALSERYVVSNLNSGDVASFSDLATALSQLGRIDRLPQGQAHETTLQLDVQGGYSRQVQVSLRTRETRRKVASVLMIGVAVSALLGAIIWFIYTVLPLLLL